jgi:2,3-bisphosphoglycerate-independent phosphoglycerate mutase
MDKTNQSVTRKTPLVLAVLDGFGHCESSQDNAIAAAKTPNLNRFMQEHVYTYISASGLDVGLPEGQMGNSEVGHMNLGAGRIVYQELTRLDKAIKEGDFYQNKVLAEAIKTAAVNYKKIHILGLLSPGGVHSHESHLSAMAKMAVDLGFGCDGVYVHAFLDGRDVPPKSAEESLAKIDDQLRASGKGKVASIIGRYYAMDRDKRWDRVLKAYELLTQGKAEFFAESAVQGLHQAYAREESDEFVQATVIASKIQGEKAVCIEPGDVVIFMNFRSDRAREITHAFVDESFTEFDAFGFKRGKKINLGAYVTLTEYEAGLPVEIAYPSVKLTHVLGQVLAEQGMRQLRIAETEKYAHVTFFFNGGLENPLPLEKRILVPSPKVATYDLKPEMSAYELTEKLTAAILSGEFEVIICNYANPDMVGHTGNLSAAIRAIEVVDECLGKVAEALAQVGGEMLVTADHGNAEKMFDEESHQAHTAHTSYPVPLIYVGRAAKILIQDGKLSDVAPTMLSLLNVQKPEEMTGRVIFSVS